MAPLTELDESVETETSHGISRRTLVKGGLVAGGALWATPVVQVLGTRIASAASASTISYVMLVLSYNGSYVTVKIDWDSGGQTCQGKPSSDWGSDTAFASYLSANNWSVNTSSSCPTLGTSVTNGTLNVTIPGTVGLVGYMVHDGHLHGSGQPTQYSMIEFAPGTTVPLGIDNTNPVGWIAPALPTGLGGSISFAKP